MRLTRRERSRAQDERILAVEAGQVACPRRGVLDLEYCFTCPAYRGFRDGHVEGLVCAGDIDSGLARFMPQV
jgi:hypothetical protein